MKNVIKKMVAAAVVSAILSFSFASFASEKLNINTATFEELVSLPEIGPSKAKDIIEFRARFEFSSIEKIKNVKGIGEKTFSKIAPLISVK